MAYIKQPTLFTFSSQDLESMTMAQLETSIAKCYIILKELKKKQKQRLKFERELEQFKEFI
tara:strand:- start:468 stop:650 length:183 start_codon:yes stop_codon:yes gene_type:complete